MTRCVYHILSVFNKISFNQNALGPAFLQRSNFIVENCRICSSSRPFSTSVNVHSFVNSNITDWAHKNNLKLNLAKSKEIISVDKRRKADFSVPAIMPELQRVYKFSKFLASLSLTVYQYLCMSKML